MSDFGAGILAGFCIVAVNAGAILEIVYFDGVWCGLAVAAEVCLALPSLAIVLVSCARPPLAASEKGLS